MYKLLLLPVILLTALISSASTILVKNSAELQEADKKALPGDIIVLKNGIWNDVLLSLNCQGTEDKPVIFRAETAGKVMISGKSGLEIGGRYIVVEGLLFTNGYAGKDPVISFRSSKERVANDCRVTNCVIDDFNNPGRMEENYWIAFYGKNNRLDHCSFRHKLNIGVLLAVILDDERSRENHHSIDHNYFGRRIPLASNGGEMIRVGVSQHCEFNSNTKITENFFEQCDGETEIVSIKSGSNEVTNNIFRECQGSVVLRHGNYNIVSGNYFLGNNKTGSGGVRVINKGQQVLNNVFFQCRGTDFRSPLAVMNGIPNSPAHRYVQVTDAVISGNTFFECTPATFCEGSDAERTLPPDNVTVSNNNFYNTKDSVIYKSYDRMDGILFSNNLVNRSSRQILPAGFRKGNEAPAKKAISMISQVEKKTRQSAGAGWYDKNIGQKSISWKQVNCPDLQSITTALASPVPVAIRLTGKTYNTDQPLHITKPVRVSSTGTGFTAFSSSPIESLFIIEGKGQLHLDNVRLDASGLQVSSFISSSKNASSRHFNLQLTNSQIINLGKQFTAVSLIFANKSIVGDSIIIRQCTFKDFKAGLLHMTEEKDNKGYYNAEKIVISNNSITNLQGLLLAIYRGGNDESTMGPDLMFSNNRIKDSNSGSTTPLISLYGVQKSLLEKNQFSNCNPGMILITYEDVVRALHRLKNNQFSNSGSVRKNEFVREEGQ
jgi:poly(beta-D-mannuronate) lyase